MLGDGVVEVGTSEIRIKTLRFEVVCLWFGGLGLGAMVWGLGQELPQVHAKRLSRCRVQGLQLCGFGLRGWRLAG